MKNVIKVVILLIIVLGLGAYLAIMSFNSPLNSEDTTYKTVTIEWHSRNPIGRGYNR